MDAKPGKSFITLRRVLTKINRHGLINSTMQFILRIESYLFDHRYGVDTFRNVHLTDLKIEGASTAFGRRYQPMLVRHVKQILKDIDPQPNDVLVDFGSGKGRVLLVSSLFSFKRIVGVEFSPELCAIAEGNIKSFRQGRSVCPIRIHCMDALNYRIDPEENIFFFFNPFDIPILNQVVRNIEASHQDYPRKIRIVLINLDSERVKSVFKMFSRITDTQLHGLPFQIYETTAD